MVWIRSTDYDTSYICFTSLLWTFDWLVSARQVSIVPVIAKSDCLTMKEIGRLKQRVLEEIAANGIKIYNLPDCDSDEDEEYKLQVLEKIPYNTF